MASKLQFHLPPKGSFLPNHDVDDPLPYYYRPFTGYLYKKRIQSGLNLISGNKYENVLEFGFGSGILLPSLAKISQNLYGIDITSDTSIVNNSLRKLDIKAELRNEDIVISNYPDNFFDLIVSFSVFEHIAEPDKILSKINRILKPNGHFMVGMPMVSKTMEKLFSLIGYQGIKQHHVTSHKEFLSMAGNYFILEKRNRMFYFLPESTSLYFNMLFTKKLRRQ